MRRKERDTNNANAQIINKVVNYHFMFEIPGQNVQAKGPLRSPTPRAVEPSAAQPPKWAAGIKRSMIFDTAYKDV